MALVLTLAIIGAQPAAAAADREHASHSAGFWEALLNTIPGGRAAQHALAGLFHITEKAGWGMDPNGTVLDALQPLPQPPATMSDGS
jgi:hypothetical protein